MKTLKKINLRGISEILSSKELRNVVGGSDGDGDGCCVYSTHWSSSTLYPCSNASDCNDIAGPNGWWCCNCDDAKGVC